jgi:hypothetical protein
VNKDNLKPGLLRGGTVGNLRGRHDGAILEVDR